MKKHPPSALPIEVWQQIEFIFRRHELSCLPPGSSEDGIEPHSVESTKRGVEILGRIWFLPAGCYDLHLCLSRPAFSSLASVTPEAIRNASISEACLVGRALRVTAAVPSAELFGKGLKTLDQGVVSPAVVNGFEVIPTANRLITHEEVRSLLEDTESR
jgi:hypothetical protein